MRQDKVSKDKSKEEVPKRQYTVEEASHYTGLSKHTFYKWIHQRKIEHVKISRGNQGTYQQYQLVY